MITSELDRIVARTPALWNNLKGKSLFLTGGTGWFGRWLLETIAHANRTLEADIRVLVLSRNPELFAAQVPHLARNPAISFHRGDVTEFAYPKCQFSHVIHAATTTAAETFFGESPLAKFDTLVYGTRRVLDFAATCGTEQFLFTSSGAAYGTSKDEQLINESFTEAPTTIATNSALGQGKRAAEFLCSTYADHYGWNLTIARCFSFVGPFQPLDAHYAIGNFIKQALNNEKIVIKGDGTPTRSYLYSGDLVTWLFTLLQRKDKADIYNVGSDFGISIRDLAVLVLQETNSTSQIVTLGQPNYSVGNPIRSYYIPDITRARNELGLDIWTPLTEAIRLSAQYSRQHIKLT
jgi:dTDP-glucose 4,6-dehydratase/UDP-glucose 4-epimerase